MATTGMHREMSRGIAQPITSHITGNTYSMYNVRFVSASMNTIMNCTQHPSRLHLIWCDLTNNNDDDDDDGVSRRNDVWAPVSLHFLWMLVWPTRPILAANCRQKSSQVKCLVSVDLAAEMDWLVKPFRRLRFSTAVAIRTSSKCCTPVRQAFCHLDLLPARSSQVAGSMPVDSRLAFKLS